MQKMYKPTKEEYVRDYLGPFLSRIVYPGHVSSCEYVERDHREYVVVHYVGSTRATANVTADDFAAMLADVLKVIDGHEYEDEADGVCNQPADGTAAKPRPFTE